MRENHVSRHGDLIVMPAAFNRSLTILVRAARFPPRIAVLQCDAALVGSILDRAAMSSPLSRQEQRIFDEATAATAPIAEQTGKDGPSDVLDENQVRVRLDGLAGVSLDKGVAGSTTLIVDADLAVGTDDLVTALDGLRRCFEAVRGQEAASFRAFVRARLHEASPTLVDFLLDYPEVTIVHVDHCERPLLEETEDARSASAVAELAQTGLCVPVEIAVHPKELSSLRCRCKQWIAINRGAGIIVSCSPGEVDPVRFAETLIELHEASLVPSDRLAPVCVFIASLGGRRSALPFPRGLAQLGAIGSQAADSPCDWHGLQGHSCVVESGATGNWNCRVAGTLYPHLLSELAAQIASNAEQARQSSGRRLRALVSQAKLVFTSEPLR